MRMLRAGLGRALACSPAMGRAQGWDMVQGLWDQMYLWQVPEEFSDLQDGHQDDQGCDDTGYLGGWREGGEGHVPTTRCAPCPIQPHRGRWSRPDPPGCCPPCSPVPGSVTWSS